MEWSTKEILSGLLHTISEKNDIAWCCEWRVIYTASDSTLRILFANPSEDLFRLKGAKVHFLGQLEFISVKPFEQAKAEALNWLAQQ